MSQDDRDASSLGVLTAVVPFMATIVALFFGMLIGGTVGWYARGDRSIGSVMAGASLADLQDACEPVVEAQKTRLVEIREEITALEGAVEEREAEVAELRAQLEQPELTAAATAELEAALDVAKESLAEARLEAQSLRRAKDELVDQLTATQARLQQTETELEAQGAIREALKSERSSLVDQNITQRWFRMLTEAQLVVCEKGSRRRTEACRDAVVGSLTSVQREFVHCLRSSQAVPTVLPVKRGEALPSHAQLLGEGDRFLNGWYVQLCDPTLPERELPDEVAQP